MILYRTLLLLSTAAWLQRASRAESTCIQLQQMEAISIKDNRTNIKYDTPCQCCVHFLHLANVLIATGRLATESKVTL